ncbi:MAG: EscU/YscU/HrcU family type III secretion system export apparatus switch protein [Acidobacteriaceae bacterium]|nr:EscU/YscU/HrcU family type III secretion system export apparatus switch protein [Acidobacteriaceae bacterium]
MADPQKTEKPTQQRLKKAREEGNFPSSRQFISGSQFLIFVTLLHLFGEKWLGSMRVVMASLLTRAFSPSLSLNDWCVLMRNLLFQCGLPLFGAGMILVVVTVSLQLGLTKMGFSFKKLTPDFNRLNPSGKLKQITRNNIPALLQALFLLPISAYVVYVIGYENLDRIMMLPLKSLETGRTDITSALMTLLWRAAALFFIFGCIDLFREQRHFTSDLRMTKQEIKEEHKQMEGDPHTKMRIRRIQREQARKRMMSQVPSATAVIVNPTHYAVALKYEPDTMVAPLVVAKGKNYLALRIRQVALDNQVPLVENPPLARGLYQAADVGQEIPPHLYKAVAEILAYIFKLMHRRI